MQNQQLSDIPTLIELVQAGVKLTPMMEQYYEVKKNYPDTLLMFRMGDFYEMFFEDAKIASKLLNISLTVRGKLGDHPIPMAGIPHHAASAYVDKISGLGKKVVICEQIEDPKQAKGIVKRAVTQVVSPGMPFDLDKTSTQENRFIACTSEYQNKYYLLLLDFTTGDFFGLEVETLDELIEKLNMYRPRELVSYLGQWDSAPEFKEKTSPLDLLTTYLSSDLFDKKNTHYYIQKLIPTYERDGVLAQAEAILNPLGALSYYVTSTQSLEKISHLRPFRLMNNLASMKVTFTTLSGLEIFPKNREKEENSLIGFMDKTKSSMGARHLRTFFQNPTQDLEVIKKRQLLIERLIQKKTILTEMRSRLDEVRDLDRIMAKVTAKKIVAGDLLNLARTIGVYFDIQRLWQGNDLTFFTPFSENAEKNLSDLKSRIEKLISPELGASYEKGNLIIPGTNNERDRLAQLSQNAAHSLTELESRYRQETGIGNLKIKYNNISGYFIEISNSHLNKVPKSFQRRQTLVNNERYVTSELEEFEKEVTSAQDKLIKLEKKIFDELISVIESQSLIILDLAKRIAQIDVYQSLAWVALQEGFSKPKLVNDKKVMTIRGAWHPLIKAQIKDHFVPHHIHLDEKIYFGLITGPNMAGKTTVMREVAIIQFLAQLGSFVPAESAELGLCDYLFSRLGASDDITKGQSTFMVEMSETAEILRHATDKSLIILDEIGRGTSTYDGVSIAWALVEHFVKSLKAITLFATHYHELIDLVNELEHAKNFTVRTAQKNGKVQFLYELIEEGATQSFGIHVAELAGLPKAILKRSKEILEKLESTQGSQNTSHQLSLFQASTTVEPELPDHLTQLESDLKTLDIMNLTPIDALKKLHDWQNEILKH